MKHSIISLFILLSVGLLAQDNATIMTINGDQVTRSEFEAIYKKNNKEADVSPAALDEYAELFVNFKLKVKEAESLKMDTVKQFVKELAGYRSQLARPYLIDTELSDNLIKEAYDRMTEEIEASHILIKLDPQPLPDDTLKAYNKIEKIKADIVGGKMEFSKAAAKLSDDPSSKDNLGLLGYFSSLQMVYPFETAAYSTKIGEVSDIVRTRFGYHILKVHDRRAARGEILTAHIMVKSKKTDDEGLQKVAKDKIDELYQELKKGLKFESLTSKYSEDKSTAKKGGELPWFGTGKMVPEFEDAAFALKSDGDYSEPVRSDYGWHIIKRLGKKDVPTFSEKEKELKTRIQKDSRSEMSQRSFIAKRKKEYGFTQVDKSLSVIRAKVDSTYLIGKWESGKMKKFKKPLFSIGDKKFTQRDFVQHLVDTQNRVRERDLDKVFNDKYSQFVDDAVIAYEDVRLEQKYPEFKALMQEYRDGILLFELTDDKVWNKAIKDTLGLREYYEVNKEDFKYEERVKGAVYTCKDRATALKVRSMVEQGMANDKVNAAVNVDTQLNLTIISGEHEKGDEPITERIPFKKGLSTIEEIEGQFVFMDVKEVLPPEVKPFDKIKGLVTAGYQAQLEEEWIKELRGKYEVKVNREVLHSIR